jgi:hypothetical protein
MTKDQAKLAALLCKLAVVAQIAKHPTKRDADLRGVSFADMEEVIEKLEDMAKGEWV